MRTLSRNKKPFYYCTYKEDVPIVDQYGDENGEVVVTYNDQVEMCANISSATGQSNTEQFGNLENYDKVIVTDDMNCPIDEHSVLFIDKAPEYAEVITYTFVGQVATQVKVTVPIPDYTVVRVAKSINSISIAVRKVQMS